MNPKSLKFGTWLGGIGLLSTLVFFSTGASTPPNLIHADPRDFLLQESDLPGQGGYSIPTGERHPIPNEMIVYLMGDPAGEERIQSTGRLLGWRVHFVRNASAKADPEDITSVVMQFSSSQGARLNLETYAFSKVNPREWQRLDVAPALGDATLAESHTETFADGSNMVYYAVSFVQNNLGVRIEVNGMQGRVDLKDALDLAAIVLVKLGQAELHRGPVPTPTPGFEPLEAGRAIYR
jgi:hypothetical protein